MAIAAGWRDNMPNGVLDPLGPRGEPIATPTDRRMLWYLEGVLAVAATNDTLRQLQTDLHAYLNETCEHHWHGYEAEDEIPAHRQCLWCHAVEPAGADRAPAATSPAAGAEAVTIS